MGEEHVVDFGAGCFWGAQERFDCFRGIRTMVGYQTSDAPPTRLDVDYANYATHNYVEVVRVYYRPSKTPLQRLVVHFLNTVHDPTQHNAQGPDVGPNYRSVVFVKTEAHRADVEHVIRTLQPFFTAQIATRVEVGQNFVAAEAYHQRYKNKARIKQTVLELLKHLTRQLTD